MQEKSNNPERENEEARRRRELTEMYGKEKAEEIMRMEKKDPAASQFHQPADQGEQDADVRSAMQNTARRPGGQTPAPMPGDAQRQSEAIQDSVEEAKNKGREKRQESE